MQVTVSTKYQVVIPKEVRRRLKLRPGQKLNVDSSLDRSVTFSAPMTFEELTNKYAGTLKNTPWQKEGIDAAVWLRKQRDAERW